MKKSNLSFNSKLTIRRESLRVLNAEESQIAGGLAASVHKCYTDYTCGERVSCYDTIMHPCLSREVCAPTENC